MSRRETLKPASLCASFWSGAGPVGVVMAEILARRCHRYAEGLMSDAAPVDPKMIERLLREGAVSVKQALALTPPACRGKGRTVSTLVRWIEEGKRGVRLEGFYGADKCWWTSAGALARFFARLTEMRLAERGIRPTSVCEDDAEAESCRRRARAANEEWDKIDRQSRVRRGKAADEARRKLGR
jgi:hypothetical protein